MVAALITRAWARIVQQLTSKELHELLYQIADELQQRHHVSAAGLVVNACVRLRHELEHRAPPPAPTKPPPSLDPPPSAPSAAND